ncbi:ROK family protein [Yinghuangia sp. YIM S09857]|uniref:ROK family protein n=1 Tax=Yinghuangia sp. YIM S09857 TaxID=3436929 RepID=UPI003F52A5E0
MTSTTAPRDVSLGVDVGGTKIAAGLVAPDGSVVRHREWPTATADRMRDPGLAGTALAVRHLLADARELDLDVTGVGIGVPEYVDANGVLTSREVLAWDEQPADIVAAELKAAELPGLPCAIGSDVRCGALGEAVHGAGRELPDFFYVSLGTGLSSAFVIDGRPWPGRRGEAIALGEFEVPASVSVEFTGNLEQFASGRGIGDRATAATGHPCAGAREATALAATGDTAALAVLTSAGRALATVLAATVRLLDPSAIVLGGGLGTTDGPVREALTNTYAALTATRPATPPLIPARLGPQAGLIGAALLPRYV